MTFPRLLEPLRPVLRPSPLAAVLFLLCLHGSGGAAGLAAQQGSAPSGGREPGGSGVTLPQGVTVGIGTQLQFTGVLLEEPTPSDQNGFRIDNARVRLYGTLPQQLSWSVTTNFGSVIEARVTHRFAPVLQLDVGLFKTPLSGEFLVSSHSIDFTSRSRVMTTLIRGRDPGVQLRWVQGPVDLRGGVFNGDGSLRGDGEEGLLGVVRLDLRREGEGGDSIRVGASLSRNGDPESVTGEGLYTRYPALGQTLAADLRWVRGVLVLSGEWMGGTLRTLEGDNPSGGHVTVGLRPADGTELLLRWDALETGGLESLSSRMLVAGVNHRPTRELRFLVNAQFPLHARDRGVRFLVRSQLYF